MVTVKINGKEITVDDNTLILDAARRAGYEIPTFCYQADLMGIGSCRMCLVEIEGQKKLQPSCVTPVLHGMSILTETPTVVSARASVLEFLLANHALDCPVCDKGGEWELQDAVHKHGPHKGRHAEKKFKFHEKDYILSPVIIKNSNRCIQCMKCVRVCKEVVGANVLAGIGRGDHQEETSFLRGFLDCDQDGNCIEVCPVGCFMRLPYRYKTRPWDLKGVDTVCTYCATGCRFVIEERNGEVLRSRAQLGVGINSETLCARGRFGFDFINSQERLKTPLVRKFGVLEPASWGEAFAAVKDGLSNSRGRTGVIASARLTNEELYLLQKLSRGVLGSPNIDSSARWDAATVEAFVSAAGLSSGAVSVFDCMETDALLVVGTHLTEENPVTDYIVRRISANRRMDVIIASVRAMRLDSSASLVLRHEVAAHGELLNALSLSLHGLNADKLASHSGIASAKGVGIERFARDAGVGKEDIDRLAKKLHAANTVGIMAGTEFLRYGGSDALSLLVDLLRAIGKTVRVLPVLDRCNQRGAWEMGAHPAFGPGFRSVPERGLGAQEMLKAASRGEIGALYIIGQDLVSSQSDENFAREALSKVRFLAVEDMFFTETAKLAHVFLPGGSFAEKEGTFTNQEGRVQALKRLIKPPGRARPDYEIIATIGSLLDPAFVRNPRNPSLTFEEIQSEVRAYGEVSLVFNNRRNNDNRLDNRAALVKGSSSSVKAHPGPGKKERQTREDGFRFTLITGNHLFHSGSLSRKSPTLMGLLKEAVVEISAEDAASLGLKSGERVRVKGRYHEALFTLMTKQGSRKGAAFIAENFEGMRRFLREGLTPGVDIIRA